MADHEELVAEMLILEQMGTQERQKLAKKRRMQQLKKWSQREKEWIAKEKQLNKRLANMLNEENNGLNLKQYITYNSNQRTKKRLTSTTNTKFNVCDSLNNGISKSDNDETRNCTNHGNNDKKSVSNSINNNNLTGIDGPYANNLAPYGRVHFNVGVMLLEAAARNDYDEVKRLLSLGVSPDSVNHDGLTALHQCCIDASEPIMNLLLEYGANVDARDTERWTPLHAACTCGHLNLVQILVEHNADLLAVNGDGNMPFDICEDEATLDYIESQMIKRGVTQEMIDLTRASNEMQMLSSLEMLASTSSTNQVNLNYADGNGVTQLHIAATNNYISVVKFLIKHGVNVNVCDNDKWTPLHGVSCWGNEQHIKVAEMLVEAGADVDAKTSNDETVFDLCDNAELLERLNQLKDEVESKHAIGTDRLRRTQSRTNSRVHSVRRTRVQDKNQISRREAREEAMLRVESSENINSGGYSEQPSSSLELRAEPSEAPALDRRSPVSIVQQHRQEASTPVETNLDQSQITAQDNADSAGCPAEGSSTLMDQLDSIVQDAMKAQSRNINNQAQLNGQGVEDTRQSATMDSKNITTLQVSSLSETVGQKTISLSSLTSNICDSNGRKQPSKGSTLIQVHLAPINYTLSNLKKHRSDLRLRGTGIAAPVQLDPEPVSSASSDGSREVDIEAMQTNGRSNAASLNKFHGQPSETIDDRRHKHKCCVII